MRLGRVAPVVHFGALCLAATTASAHDYWLAQEPLELDAGEVCAVRLLVGDELEAELERPLQRDMTTRFTWHAGHEEFDLLATTPDSTLPVFERRIHEVGTSLLVMDRKFHPIESTMGRFREFLEHEGQEDVAEALESVPDDAPLRRRYARGIKTLLRVGEARGELHAKVVGQTIEMRLLDDPHQLKTGGELRVHIQFEGQDLAEQPVKAMVRGVDDNVTIVTARTDGNGIAQFVLDRAGLWVLRTTYLRPSLEPNMDWDTHYATFSFVRP